MIRQGETVIDVDHASEAAALRTGAEWRIERKKRRRRRAKRAPRFRRMKATGVVSNFREISRVEKMYLALAEVHRRFDRF